MAGGTGLVAPDGQVFIGKNTFPQLLGGGEPASPCRGRTDKASIFGLACAAYRCTPPRNPLISLQEEKSPLSKSKTNGHGFDPHSWAGRKPC